MVNLVLAGSRREFERFRSDSYVHAPALVSQPASLLGWGHGTVLHIVGTGGYTRYYDEIMDIARTRGFRVIDHTRPRYTVIMPSMEIAHAFADRLGISPEWRHQGPQRDTS